MLHFHQFKTSFVQESPAQALFPRMLRKVAYLMEKLHLKEWLGTATVHVEAVTTVRDWKSLLFGGSIISCIIVTRST